jgi:hypothetical protein
MPKPRECGMDWSLYWLLITPAIPMAGAAWTIVLMGRGWREATAVFAVTLVSTLLLYPLIAFVLDTALEEFWEAGAPLLLLGLALAASVVLIYREVRWAWWVLALAPLAFVPIWQTVLWFCEVVSDVF